MGHRPLTVQGRPPPSLVWGYTSSPLGGPDPSCSCEVGESLHLDEEDGGTQVQEEGCVPPRHGRIPGRRETSPSPTR